MRPRITGGFAFYRVWTLAAAPGPGETRDMRDLTMVHSESAGWSSRIRPEFGALGYDEYFPTIGFGDDGLDYVSWHDFGRFPFASYSRSHLVMARNLMGGDPLPSPPVVVSTGVTDWDGITIVLPPGGGG